MKNEEEELDVILCGQNVHLVWSKSTKGWEISLFSEESIKKSNLYRFSDYATLEKDNKTKFNNIIEFIRSEKASLPVAVLYLNGIVERILDDGE